MKLRIGTTFPTGADAGNLSYWSLQEFQTVLFLKSNMFESKMNACCSAVGSQGEGKMEVK